MKYFLDHHCGLKSPNLWVIFWYSIVQIGFEYLGLFARNRIKSYYEMNLNIFKKKLPDPKVLSYQIITGKTVFSLSNQGFGKCLGSS